MPKYDIIVIYYDGSKYKAKRVQSDIPNTTAPHVYGLEPEDDVIATIASNEANEVSVYIDEEEQDLA